VLVHEMGGSIESWDGVAQALAPDCRVLRYDQRGFGLSEKNPDITLAAMVDDLAALLDALRISGPVCLAGPALGAAICLGFALRFPQRVQRLVLSSPAIGGMPPAAVAKMQAWLEQVREHGVRAITDAMFAVTYPPAMRAAHPDRFEQHRRRWLGAVPECFIALNRMLMAIDLQPELPRIQCPVLVIGCGQDSIRTPERCAELAALLPHGQFTLADSGHYMPIQHPDRFAALARSFLLLDGPAPWPGAGAAASGHYG